MRYKDDYYVNPHVIEKCSKCDKKSRIWQSVTMKHEVKHYCKKCYQEDLK